jgi:CDP-diacylglycerol--glycerol-3-phosphate 3-phosphatidyltransferase
MLNAKIRQGWDALVRPAARVAGRVVTPNAVTLTGVAVTAVAAYLVTEGRLLVAAIVGGVGGLLDALDGAVARAAGRSSRFGALLDSTTDRLSDALVFASVAWLYGVAPDGPGHDAPWVAGLALATLALSFLVSYVKARAEGLGFECNVGLIERAERLIIVWLAIGLDVVPPVLILLAVLSAVTLVQRLWHVRRQADAA